MSNPKYILHPANSFFIFFSLAASFLLNLTSLGNLVISPDFLALVLLFWNVHQPYIIGIGITFMFGIMMDVHDACLLGEHGLAYTILVYGAMSICRRMASINPTVQILYVTPILISVQLIPFIICMFADFKLSIWHYLINGLSEGILWPIINYLLLIPQHRPIDHDDTQSI
ncbi:MAG: rod shape-determining protein MreD [Burkholderia sp.]|nr:rod shape-determining protein MreD [Burkholderia sp.]